MNCTEFIKIYLKVEEKDSIIKEFVILGKSIFAEKQSNDDPKESGKISSQYSPHHSRGSCMTFWAKRGSHKNTKSYYWKQSGEKFGGG